MTDAPPSHPASGPVRRVELVAWAALLIWLWASRAVVAPDILYDWDAANYALAMERYDVYAHRPHAPGNPVFVLLLDLFTWVPGVTGPFVVVNGLLGAATLVTMGWMLRRRAGPAIAFAMAAAMSVCPPFWHQGAVATAYVAECFVCAAGGALALAVADRAARPWVAAIGLGLVIGIRPSAAPTLLPVAALALWWARPAREELARTAGAFAVACLTWLVPMVVASGGIARYRAASRALWEWQVDLGSVFGDGHGVADSTQALLLYGWDAMNLAWPLIALDLAVAAVRGRLRAREMAFLVVWFVPGAAMYALHHLPKSGYVLSLVPAVFFAWGLGIAAAAAGARRRALLAVHGLAIAAWGGLNAFAFFTAIPAESLDAPIPEIPVADGPIVTGDYGRWAMAWRVHPHRVTTALSDDLDDDRDLALYLFGAHELMRVQMALRPDQWTIATSLDHHGAFEIRGGVERPPFGDFQRVVLAAPPQGITADVPTRIELDAGGRMLALARPGRALDLELAITPGRIRVYAPCPPCGVDVGEGVRSLGFRRVAADMIAVDLIAGDAPSNEVDHDLVDVGSNPVNTPPTATESR